MNPKVSEVAQDAVGVRPGPEEEPAPHGPHGKGTTHPRIWRRYYPLENMVKVLPT